MILLLQVPVLPVLLPVRSVCFLLPVCFPEQTVLPVHFPVLGDYFLPVYPVVHLALLLPGAVPVFLFLPGA